MSYYDDDPPRRRKSRRDRDRDRPAYDDQAYDSRGPRGDAARQKALVRRSRDDDSDSVEEVQRDFPPGGRAYPKSRQQHRARSAGYDDDYYEPRRRHRGGRRRDYSPSSSSESPPRSRRKSLGEQALAALGIGGAAAEAGRGKSRDRSRGGGRGRRRDSYSSYSSRSRSRSVDQKEKIQQAVKAALTAGAVEAFRSRKEPGAWTGDKGKRIVTAAISAGGVNRALTSGRDPDKKDGRHGLEAVLGGLATSHLVNGGRSQSRSRHGRHGRDEKKGGGLKDLAAGGLAAAAGKALLDARARSKSRGRRDDSSDSDDSRGPRRNKRSSSVGAYLDKGMAALGLKDDKKPRDSRRSRRYDDDDDYGDHRSARGPPPTQGRLRGGDAGYGAGAKGGSSSSSDDDISSSEEERTRKKMGRKELVTAGLASVATIHAAHSVYSSIEARQKRQKMVREGEMSPEKARKLKNKARLQDAASVGIAAIGIKGAISEWKEMQEQRHECAEFDEKRKERHERRLRRQEERKRLKMEPQYTISEPDLNGGRQGYVAAPGGLRYQDDNPYHAGGGAAPPPPMGPAYSAHY
ncbi:MAG: hypothetical protein LQ338_002222 [Usnochroma carphineum]|nr:MAG: hypothetical protein LQ338_002222 [Usnochroma carphineum]